MTTGTPRLVLGTMTFGDTVSATDAERLLDAALDAGITDVDTANGYAKGTTEELLAPLISRRRDRIRLATKAGMPHPDAGEHSPLSPAGLRASVEGSLRRLGVDHIDLFYLHQPDAAARPEDTMRTVAELVEEGKIRGLGVSNFAAWQIVELNRIADQLGTPRPVIAQQLYNLLARRIDEEYSAMAAATGLDTVVYNPLGGGLLTGRHRFDSTPGSGRFGDSVLAGMYRQRYWDAQLFEAVDALASIAARAGVPLTELALRWLLSRPVVDAVLLGASRLDHLTSNIDALGRGPLPDDVVAACDDVGARLRGPMPAYNR
ncbi:aryl-alcohol dehydrogenase-like predicted oxidoreductase [Actinoalloteichus hoggarensis]|uniref:General stress protein 69 n=1 Tax=Actinoalloteichus hoggarensis TaxID=1470176 RepID=A0A221VWG7_9PSEU|nr:aldo/keto reductase [Actinoalloteichus hoggarensis]ASO17853.1 General stress protein 69 [Actinoalloteichus hoggarensis]MBB5924265.1 aryl-alcohol dehydrogenase-like predicted oxidoreductase [Actinoalloteichus hoggarensis]